MELILKILEEDWAKKTFLIRKHELLKFSRRELSQISEIASIPEKSTQLEYHIKRYTQQHFFPNAKYQSNLTCNINHDF